MRLLILTSFVKVDWVDIQLTQNCTKCACRQITPAMTGNGRELLVGRVPPDFVRSRSLAHEFASHLTQSPSQLSIAHLKTELQ